jgi:peptidyl-tRNA hydrolase, PTH1 family
MNKFLIVGLGNVGNEYANTRHNIGFDVVYAFVAKHGGEFAVDRLAYHAEVKIKGKTFVCICPTTYMNLSGKAVKYWLDKTKIPVENMMVILDDLSIPISKLRIRPSGSAGGHNGLKSIEESLLTNVYPRLRFGIGNSFPKGMQADYVLSKWKKEEVPVAQQKIDVSVDALQTFAFQGITAAMNEVNNKEYLL